MKVEQNLVEIVGGVNLIRDAFDVFRELNFSLQLLQVLRRRLGRHHSAPGTNGDHMEGGQGRRPLAAVAQLPHSDKSRLSLAQQDGEGKEKALSRCATANDLRGTGRTRIEAMLVQEG